MDSRANLLEQVTNESYPRLMSELEGLCMQDPELGTEQAARLMSLAIALEAYEKDRWPII